MVLLSAVPAPIRHLAERLASPLDLDAYLSTLHPLWGTRLRGVVTDVEPRPGPSAVVRIRPGSGWTPHLPGQFVTVGVDVDGVRHQRCYSLTSLPDDPLLELCVRATPDGVVSNHLTERMRAGDVVQLDGPSGDFVLPNRPASTPLLMLSGGSGVTPLLSMLRWLEHTDSAVDVVAVHHERDLALASHAVELTDLADRLPGLQLTLVESRPDGSHRLDVDRLADLCPDWTDRLAYVSGPEPMLSAVVAAWAHSGDPDRLLVEHFTPTTLRATTDTPVGRVRFARSGLEVDGSGSTLLELAESVGLDPPSGCRVGVCHTCTTDLTGGTVSDLRDGRCRSAGEPVRLCTSTAEGDVTLDL